MTDELRDQLIEEVLSLCSASREYREVFAMSEAERRDRTEIDNLLTDIDEDPSEYQDIDFARQFIALDIIHQLEDTHPREAIEGIVIKWSDQMIEEKATELGLAPSISPQV